MLELYFEDRDLPVDPVSNGARKVLMGGGHRRILYREGEDINYLMAYLYDCLNFVGVRWHLLTLGSALEHEVRQHLISDFVSISSDRV